jgi:hypothetical protein
MCRILRSGERAAVVLSASALLTGFFFGLTHQHSQVARSLVLSASGLKVRIYTRKLAMNANTRINEGIAMRSAKCIGVLIGFLCMSHPARAACSLDNALDILSEMQVLKLEMSLAGKPEQQIIDEFGETVRRLEASLPPDCANELDQGVERTNSGENRQCELLNGAVEQQLNLESYRTVAGFNYAVTRDRQAFKNSMREILKNRLTSTPPQCWFSATDMSENGNGNRIGPLDPGQCAQARAAFENCKRQAEGALQKCTGAPWIRNCAGTAPTCMPPAC